MSRISLVRLYRTCEIAALSEIKGGHEMMKGPWLCEWDRRAIPQIANSAETGRSLDAQGNPDALHDRLFVDGGKDNDEENGGSHAGGLALFGLAGTVVLLAPYFHGERLVRWRYRIVCWIKGRRLHGQTKSAGAVYRELKRRLLR
jgi:hypothetical protein